MIESNIKQWMRDAAVELSNAVFLDSEQRRVLQGYYAEIIARHAPALAERIAIKSREYDISRVDPDSLIAFVLDQPDVISAMKNIGAQPVGMKPSSDTEHVGDDTDTCTCASPSYPLSNCKRQFKTGERIRISSTGVITLTICGNGIACERRLAEKEQG